MKRVRLLIQIGHFIMLSLLISACNAAQSAPTNLPVVTSTPKPAPTLTASPIPPPTATLNPGAIPTMSDDEFMLRQNPVFWLGWSADGKMIVATSSNGLYTIKADDGSVIHLLEKEAHSEMAFSPQNNLLLAGNQVWDLTTEKVLYKLPLETIYRVNFSPDGKTLAIGEENRISLWDTATGKLQKSIGDGLGNPFFGLYFTADSSGLYAVYDEKVKLANLASDKFSESFNLPTGGCCTVFSPNAQSVMINLPNHGAGHKEVWDVQSAKMRINIENCDNDSTLTAFSADSKTMVIGPCLGEVELWDVQSQTLLHRFPGGFTPQWTGAAFSPEGSKLALSNNIGEIHIWDLTSYQLLQILSLPKTAP